MRITYHCALLAPSIVFSLCSFILPVANDPWPVPEKYQKMANPLKADAASVEMGKKLFIQHCQSCHGKKGKGDGPKAGLLDTGCGDFSLAAFQKQPDGALFYKIMEGRNYMPSFKQKVAEEKETWAIVHFIRTLK